RAAAIAAITGARSPSASKSTRKKFASWVERRTAAYARCGFERKDGGFWRAQFCTEMALPRGLEPLFCRERATSWAARRREQAKKASQITPLRQSPPRPSAKREAEEDCGKSSWR